MATTFKACAITGCNGNAHHSANGRKGLCSSHRRREGRHGDPLGGRTPVGLPLSWLRKALEYTEDKCLKWPFAKAGKGYGNVCVGDGSYIGAHVWVCLNAHGEPDVENAEAAHSCGVRLCCNPRHLRWATPKENAGDKIAHGTVPCGEAHHGAKLAEADVIEIRRLEASGVSRRSSAEAFGVAVATIEDIVHRRTWKHLE